MDILDAEGFRIFWIQKVFVSLSSRHFMVSSFLAGEAMADEDGRWTKDAAPTHYHPHSIDDRWWIIMRWRRVHII